MRGSKDNNLKWRIAVQEGHSGRKASLAVQGTDKGDKAVRERAFTIIRAFGRESYIGVYVALLLLLFFSSSYNYLLKYTHA